MKVVYSPRCLEHGSGSHPECPARLEAVHSYLKERRLKFESPEGIEEKELLIVHSKELVSKLKLCSKEGISTGDNPFKGNTFGLAKLAAGGALKAARIAEKEFAFALVRPPGHHAGRNFFSGFCYLNNLAFALRKIQHEKGIGRVLIADFDMHHGNGTQDIFCNDESVFFFSMHQNPEFTFPFTGLEKENSEHIRNVVLQGGEGDTRFIEIFKKNFEEMFEAAEPEMIAVSAGFDAFCKDSAYVGSRIGVEESGTFGEIGRIISAKKIPAFAVLEGGYHVPTLGGNVFEFINSFA